MLSKLYVIVVSVVRMQEQTMAPTDMLCKDKFLIQSIVVPADTTDEDITSGLVND